VLRDPPPKAYLVSFGDSGINMELGVWISDPEEGQLNLRSDINLAMWRAFKEHGVSIPFPQREVRMLGAQAGPAPDD
jgi:small-conductance mechanosensitive channel